MQRVLLIAIGLLVLTALVFVFQNSDPVETRLLFFNVKSPQALMLLTAMAIGFLLGVLVAIVVQWKRAKPAGTGATSKTRS